MKQTRFICRFAEWEEDGEVLPHAKGTPEIIGRRFTFLHVAVASITHVTARPARSFGEGFSGFSLLVKGLCSSQQNVKLICSRHASVPCFLSGLSSINGFQKELLVINAENSEREKKRVFHSKSF